MAKHFSIFMTVYLLGTVVTWAQASHAEDSPEIVDPSVAAKDPDFHIQGEYLGAVTAADGTETKVAAQVIARGDGQFEIYLLEGGLPGKGWKQGNKRIRVHGVTDGGAMRFDGDSFRGKILDGKMTVLCKETGMEGLLDRIERTGSTLGARPPQGAVVLFDGDQKKEFDHVVISKDGNLVAGTTTTGKFGSYRLHLEFRLSWKPSATGQARSNSGVYLHDCYEVQVLDSFGLEGKDNECGGLYQIKAPNVNMCLPPLVWQTYDAELTAPQYNADGKKTGNARLTLRHNGVVIHDDVELPHGTPGRQDEGPGPRPIHLQGHGNHVQYRNIWLVPK